MVTATGIFLGFMLDFANGWIPSAFLRHKLWDPLIAMSTISSIALLIIVLYRTLRIDYPEAGATAFYKTTLKLFIIGISIPFFSMAIVMIARMIGKIT